MGDRCFCTLYVQQEHAAEASAILDYDPVNAPDRLVCFHFDEVNYGNIEEDLESSLIDAGIAFNWEWERGASYGSGTQFTRFTEDGRILTLVVNDSEANPAIEELKQYLDKPEELVGFIKEFIEKTTPLPWDNQIEYGKLYRTKRLIGAVAA